MKYIKLFEEFVNEIEFSGHWKERSSLKHPISRVVPEDAKHLEGWVCDYLHKIDKNGKTSPERILIKDFYTLAGLSQQEFNDKTSYALNQLCNGSMIANKTYGKNTAENKAINLGKIAFKIGEDSYIPHFIYGKAKYEGDTVWGFLRDYNVGITVYFLPTGFKEGNIAERAYLDYKDNAAKDSTLRDPNITLTQFKQIFSIETLGSNKVLLITQNNWKENIEKQVKGGKVEDDIQMGRVETVKDIKSEFFKPTILVFNDSSQILNKSGLKPMTVNVKSVKVQASKKPGEPQGVSFEGYITSNGKNIPILLDKPNSLPNRVLFPGATINIVAKTEKGEREAGNLPATGVLVKAVKITNINNRATGIEIAGTVVDIFTFDGTDETHWT
jgi:hypothetical protein